MNKILAFNWKMNPTTRKEVDALVGVLAEAVGHTHDSQVVVFPPTIYLSYLQDKQSDLPLYVELGAQDISAEAEGAYTGQISAPMLADMSIPYTLIGHSETRKYQHVTNEIVGLSVHQALNAGVIPMICIGYTHHSQDHSIDYDALKEEIEAAVVGNEEVLRMKSCVIAYEPIWAIGTGITADPEMIQTVMIFIKRTLRDLLGETEVPLLYGGSITAENIRDFTDIQELDGFLVGGASLKADQIPELVRVMG